MLPVIEQFRNFKNFEKYTHGGAILVWNNYSEQLAFNFTKSGWFRKYLEQFSAEQCLMAASEMTIAFDVFQFLTIENFSPFALSRFL